MKPNQWNFQRWSSPNGAETLRYSWLAGSLIVYFDGLSIEASVEVGDFPTTFDWHQRLYTIPWNPIKCHESPMVDGRIPLHSISIPLNPNKIPCSWNIFLIKSHEIWIKSHEILIKFPFFHWMSQKKNNFPLTIQVSTYTSPSKSSGCTCWMSGNRSKPRCRNGTGLGKMGLPSGKPTKSYWKWPWIVDFPIKNGGSFHSFLYVFTRG